jgi:integrase
MNINQIKYPIIDFAYHRGRWVDVPMFYVPQDAIGEDGGLHQFRLILVDGQKLPNPSPRRPCEAGYRYVDSKIRESVLPERMPLKELKELCTRNSIPLSWVKHDYQRTISQRDINQEETRNTPRKCIPLKLKEYKGFIKVLGKINASAKVIAEILWYFNSLLQTGNDYITLEEVLRLRVEDVDVDDGFSTRISLFRSSPSGCHLVAFPLPDEIWKALNSQMRADSLFAFSNRNRGPYLPGDIDKLFKKAAKKAEIKGAVSSLSLRPKRSNSTHQSKKFRGLNMNNISSEEWEKICKLVPALTKRRGSPSSHDRRDTMNAILHHIETKTPIRKMPHWRALESQYRRWKKNGVFDQILAARR